MDEDILLLLDECEDEESELADELREVIESIIARTGTFAGVKLA